MRLLGTAGALPAQLLLAWLLLPPRDNRLVTLTKLSIGSTVSNKEGSNVGSNKDNAIRAEIRTTRCGQQ